MAKFGSSGPLALAIWTIGTHLVSESLSEGSYPVPGNQAKCACVAQHVWSLVPLNFTVSAPILGCYCALPFHSTTSTFGKRTSHVTYFDASSSVLSQFLDTRHSNSLLCERSHFRGMQPCPTHEPPRGKLNRLLMLYNYQRATLNGGKTMLCL